MKRQLTLLMVILCSSILAHACKESPGPTPECVNQNWSYVEQAMTQIEITPALKITIIDTEHQNQVEVILNPDGSSETVGPLGPITRRITVYGDNRVVFEREVYGNPSSSDVQISDDQLAQIVAEFEAANFYAIEGGCEGKQQVSCCATHCLVISVETEDQTHTVWDGGNCSDGQSFLDFCELPAKIENILGSVDDALGSSQP